MSRVAIIQEELAVVGVDEFCRRRYEREDMPLRLMRDLRRKQPLQDDLTIDRLKGSYAPELTPRRVEVLHLMAEGLTDREVATKLHIAYDTVRTHTRVLFAILDAKNRQHAVHKAHLSGILTTRKETSTMADTDVNKRASRTTSFGETVLCWVVDYKAGRDQGDHYVWGPATPQEQQGGAHSATYSGWLTVGKGPGTIDLTP